MKIGARIIKTAFAVLVSMFISMLLDDNSGFFIAMAAIITMQSTVRGSYFKGKDRIFGTIIGAVLGYVLALIQPGNPFLIALGIIFTIYLCNLLNLQGAIVIACVVFLSIMTHNNHDPLFYSLGRLLDTFIGIVVALLINYSILPSKPNSSIYEEASSVFEELSNSISKVLNKEEKVDLELFHEKIILLKEKATIDEFDTVLNQEIKEELKVLNRIIDSLLSIYEHLKFIEELRTLNISSIPFKSINDEIVENKLPDIITDFHTQRILRHWNKAKSLLNSLK